MKHKVIIAMSLVAAGVMTYLMFSGLDEGFYHFPVIRGAWGLGFMIFIAFPMGKEWLKGE